MESWALGARSGRLSAYVARRTRNARDDGGRPPVAASEPGTALSDRAPIGTPVTAEAAPAAPLLTMRGVVKRFGGVQALRGVDFDLDRGEIHALLGENGAGKSTLMNILSGVIEPDDGDMRIEGASVRFADPRAAQAAGIATIFQELDLVPGLDVTANLFLGRELTRAGVLDRAAMRTEARERLAAVGVDIDVDQPVGELSVGRRQMVAIAKALTYASRILIMDEPTAALTAAEVDRLFSSCARSPRRGVGIVYISHRLEEVPRVADRVTVMRDGQVAGVAAAERAAIGARAPARRPSARRNSTRHARREFGDAGAASRARAVSAATRARRLAGAASTSRSTCVPARSSASPASWAPGEPSCSPRSTARPARAHGRASSRSRAARRASPRSAPPARDGLGLVTDDRRGSGLDAARQRRAQPRRSTVLKRVSPFFLMSPRPRDGARPRGDPAPSTCGRRGRRWRSGALSGGNQQKVVLAKEVLGEPAPAAARRADPRRRRRRQGRDLRPHPRRSPNRGSAC